ncbi:MAG TPA: hypothetical protein VFJ27_06315 [Terriglobia bacterium]|nr:hypothetical protein [Terriglobia bacterium]
MVELLAKKRELNFCHKGAWTRDSLAQANRTQVLRNPGEGRRNFFWAIGNEDCGRWDFFGTISNQNSRWWNFFRTIGNEDSGRWDFLGTIRNQYRRWWNFFRAIGGQYGDWLVIVPGEAKTQLRNGTDINAEQRHENDS